MSSRSNRTSLVALLAIVALMTGCGAKNGPGPASSASTPKRIAVIISTLNNPWFVGVANATRAEAQSRGYKVTVFDSQNDPVKESANFDNVISSAYDAILLNATDADGSVANIKRAHVADIPVFTMDREVNTSDAVVSQVLSDNYAGAVALGQNFVEQVGEEGHYVELLGLVTDNNTWNRSKGFHSVVDRYPGLKMMAQQSADFDRSKALEVMESILQAQPDINAVFCGNDAMALGAVQALLVNGRAGRVKVFGFDGSADAINSIIQGKLTATAMQHADIIAKTVTEYADRYLKGDRNLPTTMPVAVDLITQRNASQFAHAQPDPP